MLDHKPLALLGRALAAHLGPEPSATSQGEWQCPAAPISRDRRHSERSNPGQDPAQPSPVPQGAGGAKGAAGRRVAGEGQETHCLDFGLSESRQGRRVQGGGVCKTEGVGTSFLGLLCPQIPNQDALGRSASPFSLPYPHENTAELVRCHTFLGSRI